MLEICCLVLYQIKLKKQLNDSSLQMTQRYSFYVGSNNFLPAGAFYAERNESFFDSSFFVTRALY